MDIRFDGKRALVTGAGKGIGRGLVKALLAGGAETYALSRTQADLDSLKEECPTIHTVCVDLADWDATRIAVQDIGAVDLLVNNAAISINLPFLEYTQEWFDDIMNINLKAVFNVSQVVAKGMVERGKGGSIVNISSIASKVAIAGKTGYGPSKAALDQLSRVMALELGPHQIRVNIVSPSFTITPLALRVWGDPPVKAEPFRQRSPMKRHNDVDDVVRPVLYLLSDQSDMINGAMMMVDGGYTIC